MSATKLSQEIDLSYIAPNRRRGVEKFGAVLMIALGIAGLTACANAEGTEPAPTGISVIETDPPIKAPEIKQYILTSEQLDVFKNYTGHGDLNQFAHVIGETIIPATQAYVDNLMLSRDNLTSIDTSSITANPNSPIVSRLMSLVQTQGGEPELDAKFFVCSTERETSPAICNEPGRRSSSIVNGVTDNERNTLTIVRTTGKDPFGGNEDSNIDIFIGDGAVIGLTDENQIVYK